MAKRTIKRRIRSPRITDEAEGHHPDLLTFTLQEYNDTTQQSRSTRVSMWNIYHIRALDRRIQQYYLRHKQRLQRELNEVDCYIRGEGL